MGKVQEELQSVISRLTDKQQKILLDIALKLEDEKVTPEELAEIEAGKAEIENGEWSDWETVKNELSFNF